MSIAKLDDPQKDAAPQKVQTNLGQPASRDRFAEVRRAKKKEKRAKHRARLRRSHTDG
jgi:hypothetical protein